MVIVPVAKTGEAAPPVPPGTTQPLLAGPRENEGAEEEENASLVTRPKYPCTVCEEVFESKSSWRCHESGQHFQSESWICLPCSKRGSPAWAYPKASQFEEHLARNHSDLSFDIQKGHLTSKFGHNFWCGICADIIPKQQKRDKGEDERLAHIKDHWTTGCTVAHWKKLSPVKPSLVGPPADLPMSRLDVREELEVEAFPAALDRQGSHHIK